MLTESTTNLQYEKLSKEEMEKRGILGRLVGVCADFLNPTRNGRKYPEKLWENVFNDPIMKEKIENGVVYGELGHPADREETDMEKIAVCLTDVPKKGPDGKLRAVFDILSTPNGKILKSLCDYGSTLGISSRGSGDLETDYDGNESVNPDSYSCEGFDVVLLPAVKEARLQYVTESLDKTRYNKTLRQRIQESLDKATDDEKKIMLESLKDLGVDLDEGLFPSQTFGSYGFVSSRKVLNNFKKVSKLLSNELSLYDEVIEEYESNAKTDEEKEALETNEKYRNLIRLYNRYYEYIKELNRIIKDGTLTVDKSPYTNDTILLNQDVFSVEDLYDLLEKLKEGLKTNNLTKDIKEELDNDQLADDDDMAMLEELNKALKLNQALDKKVTALQEKLSVSNAKENELEEKLDNYKIKIAKLSNVLKEKKALTTKIGSLESLLEEKNTEISVRKRKLIEEVETYQKKLTVLKESIKDKDVQLAKLTEKLNSSSKLMREKKKEVSRLTEDCKRSSENTERLKEKYDVKLEQSSKLVEKYKNIAKSAVNKYINSQAVRLGTTSKEITNRLPESYTFDDIDRICEDLKEYNLNISSLPFDVKSLNESGVKVKGKVAKPLVTNPDGELSDFDIKLAEKFS